MVDVAVLQLLVQVDGVWVQKHGVFQRCQERLGEGVGEEGVFVWCLVAAYSRVHHFLLLQDPVEKGAGVVGDLDLAGLVDCGVERELDALDEVEDYGVFETAVALGGRGSVGSG